MEHIRVIRAASKGRVLLGKEFAGAFLGMNTQQNGIFLEKVQFVSIKKTNLREPSSKILDFAGAWDEMPEKDFTDFLKTTAGRRKKSGSKRKKF